MLRAALCLAAAAAIACAADPQTLAELAVSDRTAGTLYEEVRSFAPGAIYLASGTAASAWTDRFEIIPGNLAQVVAIAGQPFTHALEVKVPQKPVNYWEAHFKIRNTGNVRAGEHVHFSLWSRNLVGGVTGKVKINTNGPDASNWGPELDLTDQWRRHLFTWTAPRDFAPGAHEFMFSFGFEGNLGVQLAGLIGVVFPASTDVLKLPTERLETTYPGQEPHAAWRIAALKRIADKRMAPLAIRVVDAAGRPVSGAGVTVQLARHAFIFGTVVDHPMFPDTNVKPFGYWGEFNARFNQQQKTTYLAKLVETCNAAVALPNWYAWYEDGESGPEMFEKVVAWCAGHGLTILGNDPVYRDQYAPRAYQEAVRSGDRARIEGLVREYLQDYASRFGKQARCLALMNEWDINPVRAHYITAEDPHGYAAGIPWFKALREFAPNVKLGFNDPGPSQAYIDRVRFMEKHGMKIDWVGFQWHLSTPGVPPEQMLKHFDEFAKLGVNIEVTEFDAATPDLRDPAQVKWQRDYLRDFYIACMSHPAVTGIVKWGIWEPAIWDSMRGKNTAFYDQDWNWTILGAAYRDLVLGEWKTKAAGTTGLDGAFAIRGFLGDYTITVTAGGRTAAATAKLVGGGTRIDIKLP